MRLRAVVTLAGAGAPVSPAPFDVLENGVAGARWSSSDPFAPPELDDARAALLRALAARLPAPPLARPAILVRLPRRLSATRRAPGWRERKLRGNNLATTPDGAPILEAGGRGVRPSYRREPYPREPVVDPANVVRWIRGELPVTWPTFAAVVADRRPSDGWELVYPQRGLGLPKQLPRRALSMSGTALSTLWRHFETIASGGQRPLPGDFFACVHGMYIRANARVLALTVAEIQPMRERLLGEAPELTQRADVRTAPRALVEPVSEVQIVWGGLRSEIRLRLADPALDETQTLRDFDLRPRQRRERYDMLGQTFMLEPREFDLEFILPNGDLADALVRRARDRASSGLFTCELVGPVGRIRGDLALASFTWEPTSAGVGWWRFSAIFMVATASHDRPTVDPVQQDVTRDRLDPPYEPLTPSLAWADDVPPLVVRREVQVFGVRGHRGEPTYIAARTEPRARCLAARGYRNTFERPDGVVGHFQPGRGLHVVYDVPAEPVRTLVLDLTGSAPSIELPELDLTALVPIEYSYPDRGYLVRLHSHWDGDPGGRVSRVLNTLTAWQRDLSTLNLRVEHNHARRQLGCSSWHLRGDILYLAVPLA